MSDDYETIVHVVKENKTKTTFTVEVEHDGEQTDFDRSFYSNGYYNAKWTASTVKTKTEEVDVEVEERRSIAHKKVENKIAKKIVFDTLKKAGYPRLKSNESTPHAGKYCRISCTWAKSWKNRTSNCIFDVVLLQEPRTEHHSNKRFRIYSVDEALKIEWDHAAFAPSYDWQRRQEFIYTKEIPFADPDLADKLEVEIEKMARAMMHADTCWRSKWSGERRRYRAELDNDQYKELLKILNEPNDKNGAENSS